MRNQALLDQLANLVDKYLQHRQQYVRSNSTYNETLLRNDFLNPFLEILGWDVQNKQGVPQHLREVVHEDTVEFAEDEEGIRKKPDYALRLGSERKFFVEAKNPPYRLLITHPQLFKCVDMAGMRA